MSSVAAARRSLAAGLRGRAASRPGAPIGAALAVALAAVAFVGGGGLRLEPTTHVEIALLPAGAALAAAALLAPARAPLYGGWALLGLALLGVYTALSVIWSVAPSDSWEEASRTFAYVAVFAGAIAIARLAPWSWQGVLGGVAGAAVLVCGWALLTKVFPAALAADETYARLRAPYGYWNAVGLTAAMGVPPLLWLAARRTGHAAVNALAWPGLGLLLTCLMLSYSRGALLALALGLAFWFAVVPLRLRGAGALAAGIVGAALPVAWAFAQDDLTSDSVPLPVRTDAGHELGALLVLALVGLLVVGLAVNFALAQRPPSPRARLLAGGGALGVLALVPVVGVIALATADGGIGGQVSKAWDQMTNPEARTPANRPDRLTATASVRARYWREGFNVHAANPWIGVGAGGYATARTRYRTGPLAVRHAHGQVVQTLADLGWIGLALTLAGVAAWLAAAARATGLTRRDWGRRQTPERIGLLTLTTVALVFGVHSLVDWTWFIPGTAVVGLLCAAFVAARGPLGAVPAGAPEPRPAGAPEPRPWRERLAGWRPAPLPAAAAVLVLGFALATAWSAYQPVRAVHAGDAAVERLGEGEFVAAAAIARIGAERNPLATEPLWELAAIEERRGRLPEANAALERAVHLQPARAETWRRLGRLRLARLGDPRAALAAFRAALYLDPSNPRSTSDLIEARRAL